MHAAPTSEPQAGRHRPRALTVFVAAFVAGAAAAVGVNRALDVHLAQKKPQVESEPIFVALRSLAQGSPITVWDVALRDWPKAMLPTSAMRADDSFEGCVLRHPLREGQPLLSVQLVRASAPPAAADATVTDTTFTPPVPAAAAPAEADLWTPARAAAAAPAVQPVTEPSPVATAQPVADVPQPATSTDVAPPAAPEAAAVAAAPGPAEEPAAVIDQFPAADTTQVPVATAGEPTLADPLPGEPTPADTPPPPDVGLESVVAAQSVTAPDVEAARPTVAPHPDERLAAVPDEAVPADAGERRVRDGVVRYLVVPERIALQADAGFAAPSPAPAPAPQPGLPPRSASAPPGDVQPLPPVRQQQAGSRPRAKPSAQQPSSRSRTPANQPNRQQPSQRRQPSPAATRPAATEAPRGLGALFPNIAAGIGAMRGDNRQSQEFDAGVDEAVATDDPTYRQR